MKVGAEPRKVALLTGLIVVAGYLVYTNAFSSSTAPAAAPRADTAQPARQEELPVPEVERTVPRTTRPRQAGIQAFRPTLVKPGRAGDAEGGVLPDLSEIDATLRLDLLAKLHEVTLEGGKRSLFEFGTAPLPKKPEPKIIPKEPEDTAKKPEDAKPPEKVKPPPPRIPLKFYGFTTQARQGNKRAFFLDGDEIFVASEGDVVKKRYKVVRIGVNSVVVEDLQHDNEQTLPLEAEVG